MLMEIAPVSFVESHRNAAPEAVLKTYVRQKFSKESLTGEFLDQHSRFYVLNASGKTAGYAKLILNHQHPLINGYHVPCKLERLYLLPEYTGTGLGKLLFDFCLTEARNEKQDALYLTVYVENFPAIKFYKRCGFIEAGVVKFSLGDFENDNYLMSLEL